MLRSHSIVSRGGALQANQVLGAERGAGDGGIAPSPAGGRAGREVAPLSPLG
jgi:hypothetical protein